MRIALLIYNSLETVSGGYLYDRKLVEHLRRQGDQVEIISIPWRNYAAHLTDNFSHTLFNHLRQLQVDVLLQDELNHPSLFLLNRRLRKEVRFPIVTIVHHLRCSEHRPKWLNNFYRLIEKQYLGSVDALVLNSHTTRQTVTQLGDPFDNQPHLIAYPAGDRFKPSLNNLSIQRRALQPSPLKIVFIGNLIPRKGLHTLLQALYGLPDQMVELSIIGSPSIDDRYARKMRKLVSELGLTQMVNFLGMASDDRMTEILTQSQLLVVPSSYEGFGIVYLEGMSFGLPAIGTNSGGAAEIITHGVDGFLIQPGDVTSLQTHLVDLAHNRQKLAAMGVFARQRFETHPGWEETSQSIREFLKSVSQNR